MQFTPLPETLYAVNIGPFQGKITAYTPMCGRLLVSHLRGYFDVPEIHDCAITHYFMMSDVCSVLFRKQGRLYAMDVEDLSSVDKEMIEKIFTFKEVRAYDRQSQYPLPSYVQTLFADKTMHVANLHVYILADTQHYCVLSDMYATSQKKCILVKFS
jgi:hypothetical protein